MTFKWATIYPSKLNPTFTANFSFLRKLFLTIHVTEKKLIN